MACKSDSLRFQVSHPYSKTERTDTAQTFAFVLTETFRLFHNWSLRELNAAVARPMRFVISCAASPVPSTRLPRYLKCGTTSKGTPSRTMEGWGQQEKTTLVFSALIFKPMEAAVLERRLTKLCNSASDSARIAMSSAYARSHRGASRVES